MDEEIILTEEDAPVKKKSKKKPIIIIVILAVVIAALAVVAVLLFNKESGKKKDADRDVEQMFTLSPDIVKEFEVNTTNESYTIKKNADNKWEIEGLTTVEVSDSAVSTYLNGFTALISIDSVGEASKQDLSQFGLKPALGSIKLKFIDNKELTMEIGKQSPYDQGSFFVSSASPKLYIANTKELYFLCQAKSYFYNMLLGDAVSSSDAENSSDKFDLDYLQITQSGEEQIRFEKMNASDIEAMKSVSSYQLTYPFHHPVSQTALSDTYTALKTLSGVGIITDKTDKKALKICGLDNPKYQFDYSWNGEKKKIVFADATDDMYYAYKTGGKYIFLIYKVTIDDFIKRPYEYCEDVAYLDKSITEIKKLVLKAGETTCSINISGDSETLKATTDSGQEIKSEDLKQYFVNFQQILVKDETTLLGNEDVILEVDIYPRKGTKTDVIKFYKIDELTALLQGNGENKFTVDINTVNTLIADIQNLIDGKEIKNLW